jgi:hypothetical protein
MMTVAARPTLVGPGDFFRRFVDAVRPHEDAFRQVLSAPAPRSAASAVCRFCQSTDHVSGHAPPLCRACRVDRARLTIRDLFAQHARDQTWPCAFCGLPSTPVVPLSVVRGRSSVGPAKVRNAWRRPDSSVSCLGCAAAFLVSDLRDSKLGTCRLWLDADGALQWTVGVMTPWWRTPPPPALVIDVPTQQGAQVNRMIHTEPTLDGRVVIVNRIVSSADHPLAVALPRLDADQAAALEAVLADETAWAGDPAERSRLAAQLAVEALRRDSAARAFPLPDLAVATARHHILAAAPPPPSQKAKKASSRRRA